MFKKTAVISLLIIAGSSATSAVHANQTAGLKLDKKTTALLITDPQNDFLSENGAAYELVKENLDALGTIENIGSLFKASKKSKIPVFVSPHQYFSHDEKWKHRGELHPSVL